LREVYTYWNYPNVIGDEIIDKIMKIGDREWTTATTAEDFHNNERMRKTDIIWTDEQWLYELFLPYMINANTNWNLNIDSAEAFQLGRYKDGGHYDYHTDGDGLKPIDVPPEHHMYGKTRKISMVLWLNEDFEGGEFQFYPSICTDGPIKPTKGTLIFFPSWHMHKVHPVTKGTRYSLVTWFNGNPVN